MGDTTLFNLGEAQPASTIRGLVSSLQVVDGLTHRSRTDLGQMLCFSPSRARCVQIVVDAMSSGDEVLHHWWIDRDVRETEADKVLPRDIASESPVIAVGLTGEADIVTDLASTRRLLVHDTLGSWYATDPTVSWVLGVTLGEWVMLIRPAYRTIASITRFTGFRTPNNRIVQSRNYSIAFGDDRTWHSRSSPHRSNPELDAAVDFISRRSGVPVGFDDSLV